MTTDAAPRNPVVFTPESYAQERYWLSTAPVRVFSSRVGRGKTYIGCARQFVKGFELAGINMALTRLERASMETTTLETLRDKIIPSSMWARRSAGNYSVGWVESDSTFYYPPVRCARCGYVHQSKIRVFGWLDPGRQLSAEFGDVTVDQAEQLERKHHTIIVTRMRQNEACLNARAEAKGLNPRQIGYLFNPEDSEHWAAQEYDPDAGMREIRDAEGRLAAEVILSSYHDNEQHLPPNYHVELEALKGTVFYDRLVGGKWAKAEGLVFPMYDPAVHLVTAPPEWAEWNGCPPPHWPRYRGIDFGYRNPFVNLWVARSPGGVHYVYREWSMSERLVEDHAEVILQAEATELKALRNAPALTADNALAASPYLSHLNIQMSFADHDAEDAATLARYGVHTVPAKKDIGRCIQAIAKALSSGRLKILAGSLMQEDRNRDLARTPRSLPAELSRLTWEKQAERSRNPKDDTRERPVDANNHRVDALGYILYSLEATGRPSVWTVGA